MSSSASVRVKHLPLGNIGTAIIFFSVSRFCIFFSPGNCSGVRCRRRLSNELLFQFAFKGLVAEQQSGCILKKLTGLSEHDGVLETRKSFEFLC